MSAAERPLTANIRPDREPLDLKAYEKAGGYQGLRKALKDDEPPGHHQGTGGLRPARPRRRRLSHRHEMEVPAGSGATSNANTWWPTPTRWSRAPSRTASCLKAIRTR